MMIKSLSDENVSQALAAIDFQADELLKKSCQY